MSKTLTLSCHKVVEIMFLGRVPWVPEVFFSVSWEGKKTFGNGGQLIDCAAPIGFK